MAKTGTAAEAALLTVLKVLTWIVYALATAAEIFLAFMFFLQMLGANPNQPFVAFIYRWGHAFARPFKGMVPPTLLGGTRFIDWNALIAIFAYLVLAWLLSALLGMISRRLRVDHAAVQANRAAVAPTSTPGSAAPGAAPLSAQPAAQPPAEQPAPMNEQGGAPPA